MELLHAYPTSRLARANGIAFTTNGQMVPGTKILFAGSTLIANETNGLSGTFTRETITADITDGVDPARTESYWVTCGWKWTSRGSNGAPGNALFLGTKSLASPNQIFAMAGGVVGSQVAYVEQAYNPITKEIRIYVNGNRLAGNFVHDNSVLSVNLCRTTGDGASVWITDIYIARFEGNEEPRLRRWKAEALLPATNGIGANIDKVDGQVVSVQGTELVATYTLPANTIAAVVDVSAESVNNASDLTGRVTDGTTTSNKRLTGFNGPLGTVAGVGSVPYDFRGHGMAAGSVKPAANATTLTVGVKAVDRT